MSDTSVNPINSNIYNVGQTVTLPAKMLTQQDFLKLLVAQMTAQDPLNPQSNTDFAAQMAQFSALQTSQTTEANLAKLRADQQVTQATSLLGRAVTVVASDGSLTSGMVSAVQMNGTSPELVVNGGLYDLSQVLSIQPAPTTDQTTQ